MTITTQQVKVTQRLRDRLADISDERALGDPIFVYHPRGICSGDDDGLHCTTIDADDALNDRKVHRLIREALERARPCDCVQCKS